MVSEPNFHSIKHFSGELLEIKTKEKNVNPVFFGIQKIKRNRLKIVLSQSFFQKR